MKFEKFKTDNTCFEYYYEDDLKANEIVYLKMPPISANKRSINDIGWQCESEMTVYATLSHKLSDDVLWSEIKNEQEINKTVQYLKIAAGNSGGKIYVRANLN